MPFTGRAYCSHMSPVFYGNSPNASNICFLVTESDGLLCCNQASFYKTLLLDKPFDLRNTICNIFLQIHLDDLGQQREILDFFMWLKEKFMPFLARAEQFMLRVRYQLDSFLRERHAPHLQEMLSTLRNHFIVKPLLLVRFIFVNREKCRMRDFSTTGAGYLLSSLTIAQLRASRFDVSQDMAERFNLTIDQFRVLLSNVKNFPRLYLSKNQRKSFWKRFRAISIAQIFLIRKLVGDKSHDYFRAILLLRVLRYFFSLT